ncbi:MAG: YeeE/YedE family protein [Bradyrhizobiaceae bacterium]|nr:YeeE/YedE family protein [Bradyrhizobiaceae bacterium]
MAAFDPISALFGGALIGVAATLLLFLNGRIAGISGIFGDFLDASAAERGWRLAFLAGLIAAPLLLAAAGQAMPNPTMPASWAVIIGAGLLVGVGTRLAGGCTSGHGICGLARFSPRSIVATGVFMATAVIVVAIVRHGLGA